MYNKKGEKRIINIHPNVPVDALEGVLGVHRGKLHVPAAQILPHLATAQSQRKRRTRKRRRRGSWSALQLHSRHYLTVAAAVDPIPIFFQSKKVKKVDDVVARPQFVSEEWKVYVTELLRLSGRLRVLAIGYHTGMVIGVESYNSSRSHSPNGRMKDPLLRVVLSRKFTRELAHELYSSYCTTAEVLVRGPNISVDGLHTPGCSARQGLFRLAVICCSSFSAMSFFTSVRQGPGVSDVSVCRQPTSATGTDVSMSNGLFPTRTIPQRARVPKKRIDSRPPDCNEPIPDLQIATNRSQISRK